MTKDIRTLTGTRGGISRRQFVYGTGAIGLAVMLPRSAMAAENTVIWYTGSKVDAVNDWVLMFKEQTGITCDYYRAGSLKIARRFEQEVKADQIRCSLVSGGLVGLIKQWANTGLLLEHKSPEYSHYPKDLMIGNFAAPIKADVVTMIYNTELLKADEVPQSWLEILEPKWKGKMVMSDASSSSGALHWYGAMRKAYGRSFMEKLAKQQVMVQKGSGTVVNTVISGERPIAAMVHQYHALGAIGRGAHLRVIIPVEGAPVGYTYLGIVANGINPEGAKKFMDFAVSHDAQAAWQQKYFTGSVRDDMPESAGSHGAVPLSTMKRINSTPGDMVEFFNNNASLADEWVELFKS